MTPPAALLEALTDEGGLGFDCRVVGDPAPSLAPGMILIGVHSGDEPPPAAGLEPYDIVVTDDPGAPAPYVPVPDITAAVAQLSAAIHAQSAAAAVAAQVLRVSLKLSFAEALTLESLAYSMLLASDGFRRWREASPPRPRGDAGGPRVGLSRDASGAIRIRLARPAARNAVDAAMRDALVEALRFAADDPDAAPVILDGEGPSFCAGGDLSEFGSLADPALAHATRTLRSATGAVAAIAPRVTVRLHGACIGAGIETPAAAGRVLAAPDTRLRLPEVAMGLIPGAGGTASIPRRIGRHRTCWLAVTGAELDAQTALAWGLVDEVGA